MRFWLFLAAVMALCYFAQPLDLYHTVAPAASVDSHVRAITEGSSARQLSLLLMGIWAAGWIVARRSQLRLDGRLAAIALAFLFLVLASIGWADDPWLSAKRAAALLVFAVCCVAIAQQVGVEDSASLVFWGGTLTLALSVGAELALRTFTPLDPAYRFAGLMHANDQGIYCGCLALAGLSLARRGRPHAAAYAVAAGVGFCFLLLTKSRISLVSALAGLAFYAALTSAHARYWLLVASTVAAFAAVPVVVLGLRGAAPFWAVLRMGRPEDVSAIATLTGRTELWQVLMQHVSERPLLGYGYGGFWTPQRLTALVQHEGWALGSAHSQYFEVLLQLGVVGLTAFCATAAAAFLRLVRGYWRHHVDGHAFAAALLVLVGVDMLVESRPFDPSLPMLSCLAVVAALAVSRGAWGPALRR